MCHDNVVVADRQRHGTRVFGDLGRRGRAAPGDLHRGALRDPVEDDRAFGPFEHAVERIVSKPVERYRPTHRSVPFQGQRDTGLVRTETGHRERRRVPVGSTLRRATVQAVDNHRHTGWTRDDAQHGAHSKKVHHMRRGSVRPRRDLNGRALLLPAQATDRYEAQTRQNLDGSPIPVDNPAVDLDNGIHGAELLATHWANLQREPADELGSHFLASRDQSQGHKQLAIEPCLQPEDQGQIRAAARIFNVSLHSQSQAVHENLALFGRQFAGVEGRSKGVNEWTKDLDGLVRLKVLVEPRRFVEYRSRRLDADLRLSGRHEGTAQPQDRHPPVRYDSHGQPITRESRPPPGRRRRCTDVRTRQRPGHAGGATPCHRQARGRRYVARPHLDRTRRPSWPPGQAHRRCQSSQLPALRAVASHDGPLLPPRSHRARNAAHDSVRHREPRVAPGRRRQDRQCSGHECDRQPWPDSARRGRIARPDDGRGRR